MVEIALFHSVLGVRPAVLSAAERLRAAGHIVHVPDLYQDGTVFDDYKKASEHTKGIGYDALLARTREAVSGLPPKMVYAGFSSGAGSAQLLAATRTGALGAILLHGAEPLAVLSEYADDSPDGWPSTVPVQVHFSEKDPFRDPGFVESLASDVEKAGARFEFYEYPGDGHLFADEGLPAEYDKASAELMWKRVLTFLESLDA